MSNVSIKLAFERMWHHVVTALSNIFACFLVQLNNNKSFTQTFQSHVPSVKLDKTTFAEHLTETELPLSSMNGKKFKLTIDDTGTLTVSEIIAEEVE